jgi:hypothetical protein
MTTGEPPVTRAVQARRVYYISGFDPRGAAFYHRLYRDEASKQSIHHDAQIRVGQRSRSEAQGDTWSVEADWGSTSVSTEYRFLAWDDIVREHWEPNLFKLLFECIKASAQYVKCGAFRSLRQTFRGPLYTVLYPVAYFLLLITASLLFGYGVAHFVGAAFPIGALALLPAVAVGGGIFFAGTRIAERVGILWLLRIYLFVYKWGAQGVPALEARMNRFAETIVRDQAEHPCDEVLVVGHSVGSMVAVSVAAHLAETLPAAHRKNLTLLTLGQCIPLLSLVPAATAFRQALARLAQAKDIPWLDMHARADSLCFSQANPLDASGVAGQKIGRPVKQVVRPFRMFDAAEYARIRRDKLRLHFQYLMASAHPDEYDYFRMTAGPDRIEPF